MVYTAPNFKTQALDVNSVTEQFQSLSTDDKLGLLWVAYTEIGRSITRISHKICDRQTQKPYRKWV